MTCNGVRSIEQNYLSGVIDLNFDIRNLRYMKKVLFAVFTSFLLIGTINIHAQLKVPPVDIKVRELKNGLKIVTHQDNSNPTVAIQLWYDVGGKNDPIGKSGFAHMFEHMMFKATKNMPSETIDRLTEDVGGFNNASTRSDYTNYYEVVPSNHLERLLWAEADRMVNLNVDKANFDSEREVVKEEFRQGVLANPYGRFFEMLDALSFKVHPYKHGVIGDLEQLDAATLEDAAKFYKDFYRPDNAALIVVGDFDQKQLDGWIDKYFSVISKPETKIERVTVTEPEWKEERRFNETGPIVPFPAAAIIFLAPPSNHKDVPALRIAESILSRGESSRLHQSLVRNQQVAQHAGFTADIRLDQGLLYFLGIGAQEATSVDIEKALLAELKKIQDEGVSVHELEKAKNQLIANIIRQRETNSGKANEIESAIAYLGDPRAFNSTIEKLQAVTAADVQRVMKSYFKDNNRVVIHYNEAKSASEEN